jgi:sialidase-1
MAPDRGARPGPWRSRILAILAAAALAALQLPAQAASARPPAADPASAADAAPAADAPAADSAPADGGGGFDQQVLFKAAREQGYSCFRIPAVVKAKDGTLLAFAEGRVDNCGDAGDIDVVLKRSTDGGRTWGPLQVVNEGGGETHGNPVPIVDRSTGRIVLATTYNKATTDGSSCVSPCDRTPHMQYSDDDGATWSPPRDLTSSIRRTGWNSWYATGPVHGIQLTGGPHPGRLVFGINAESWSDGRITTNHAALVHSDDDGATWQIGAVDSWPVSAADGTFRQKPSEMSLVQLDDGSIYVGGRETDGTDLGNRDYAVSRDGGDSFTAPFRTIPDLYTPMVQGSILRLRDRRDDGYDRLLLSSPADPDRRRTMMIRSSYDEGRTWDSVDRGRVVTTDWSGYSDLVGISHDETGLLYEGGAVDARDEIRFARFTEQWLGGPRGRDPQTPDLVLGARGAAVLGGPRRTPGRFGSALAFDGTDDAVRLPYSDALPLGTHDFTVSLWMRYTATGGQQPLMSMGGIGTTSPQVALSADPAAGRITATIRTRVGSAAAQSASVSTPQAYDDGRWHQVALRRSGGRLTLTVDGASVEAPDLPGTVSRTSPFGVHLGQTMDSRTWFTGSLDEVRVYDRALSDTELGLVRAYNVPIVKGAVLRLPLDTEG